MPALFHVKATFDYLSPHEDDLSFPQGQIITVTELEDDEWYIGEYTDASGAAHSGLFPKNFVERYEPAPPPRPSRSARPKPAEQPVEQATPPAPAQDLSSSIHSERAEREVSTAPPATVQVQQQAPAPPPAAQAVSPPANNENTKVARESKSPPPVSEKPSSFKDRIAAFNKSAAPPIAPFKPSALGSSGFIKKPFVAPPPSRDAYVPPPTRDIAPQKLYRREEDPEIAERQAQDQENAEKAGLLPSAEDVDEDAPKAVSLKERIALLQKQQAEQAARRGDAAGKEKPKKPPKKRVETQEVAEEDTQPREAAPRASTDAEDERPAPPQPQRAPRVPEPSFSDGNDADQSAAGENTEPEGASGLEDERVTPRAVSRVPTHDTAHVEDEAEESEEEEDMDEETRHQMALRERMAKLSGGMGMPGMFGPPGGMPMMGMAGPPKKKKTSDSKSSAQNDELPVVSAPRVPTMPVAEPTRNQSFDQRRSLEDNRVPQPSKTRKFCLIDACRAYY
jgi:hypothetical protein